MAVDTQTIADSNITKGFKELVAEANATVRTYSPEEAIGYLDRDGVLFVDVRDAPELSAGMIPGAVHASRGMRSSISIRRVHTIRMNSTVQRSSSSTVQLVHGQRLPLNAPRRWG